MKKIVYLVPHCHWDREWYFSNDTSNILFHNNMKELINQIDKQKMFLDGQWSLLDDYLKTSKEDEIEVKRLLRGGSISSGPFYAQPDVFNSQGETILRNIEIGKLEAKRYGVKNNDVAYLPDTFGFSENFPNLLKHEDINNFVFWRGIPKELVENSVVNEWFTSNSKVKSLCLKEGYYSLGMYYPYNGEKGYNPEKLNPKKFAKAIYARMKNQKGFKDAYIFPMGGDQAPFISNQCDFIKEVQKEMLDVELILTENYEKYFETTKGDTIPKYRGAMDIAYTGKIHKTITSSRYDIKKMFRSAEDKLYYRLEPLEVLYKTYDQEYDFQTYKNEKIIKPLLIAQTHDSLGGCNTDSTNQFQLTRLKRIHENIDSQIDLLIKKIMQYHGLLEDGLLIFNPSLNTNSLFKRMCVYSKDLKTIDMNNNDIFVKTLSSENLSVTDTPLYRMDVVLFADDLPAIDFKWLTNYENKKINSMVNNVSPFITLGDLSAEFAAIEDKGDSYDFSPGEELVINQSHKEMHKYEIKKGVVWKQIESTVSIGDTTQKFIWDVLDNDSDIEILGFTNNLFKNIKLSLKISGLKTKNIKMTQNLGTVDFVENDVPTDWSKNLMEYPVNLGVTDGIISIGKHKIMTFGNNEFYKSNGSIEITLFRSYGFVTNKDLTWRPLENDLNWYEDSKDSQLNKRLDFRFVISKNKDMNILFNTYKFKPYAYFNQQRNFIANKMTKFIINYLDTTKGSLNIESSNRAAVSSFKLNKSNLEIRVHNLMDKVISETLVINGLNKEIELKNNEIKLLKFKI